MNATQRWKSFFVLLILASGLFWASFAQASSCDIFGGTSYKGCQVAVKKYTGYLAGLTPADPNLVNKYFDTREDASEAVAEELQTYPGFCPQCNYGLLTAPLVVPPGATCHTYACSLRSYTSFSQTPASMAPYYYVGTWGVTVWGVTPGSGGSGDDYYADNRGVVATKWFCPARWTLTSDYTADTPQQLVYVCVPPSTANNALTNLDSNQAGNACGCNPVDLVSFGKMDHEVDYTSDSPYPIVWERFFSSQTEAWTFGYDRKLVYSGPLGSTVYATLTRTDGSVETFSAPYVAGTTASYAWVPPASTTALAPIQTALTDTKDASGNLVGFTLFNRQDEQEFYSASGVLQYLQNRQGHRITLTHDAQNRVTQVQDDYGHALTMTYASPTTTASTPYTWYTGNVSNPTYSASYTYYASVNAVYAQPALVSVSDGTSTINYTWTVATQPGGVQGIQLTGVTHEDATTTGYTYGEAPSYTLWTGTAKSSAPYYMDLTGIVGEDGARYATYYYSTTQKVSATDHGGGLWRNYFQPNNVRDGLGNAYSYKTIYGKADGFYQPCPPNVCAGSGIQPYSISYDTLGNPTSVTDQTYNATPAVAAPPTTYAYGTNASRGLPVTRVEASGTSLARTTTWTWDPVFHLPLTQVEPMAVSGAAGTRTTTWTRDAAGNATSVLVHTSSGEPDRTWAATYNGDGNVLTATSPLSETTTYTYGTDGRLASVQDPVGHTTTVDSYTLRGSPTQWTDPNGLVTQVVYDLRERPTQAKRGSASTHWETTTMAYLPTGLVSDLTTPTGRQVHFRYDAAHRLVGIDLKDTAGALLGTVDYTLDVRSLKTAEIWKDASGTVVQSHTATYDAYSRLATDLGTVAGETNTYIYDLQHHPVQATDPLSHTTKQTYDALGRALVATDALTHTATLAYDPSDHVVSATDPSGHATTYAYNGFGEEVGLTSPDAGSWAFTVDGEGRRVGAIDPRGASTTWTYDANSRVTSLAYSDLGVAPGLTGFAPGSETQTFTYDACTNGLGRLCSMTDASGTTSYAYDLWGRVTSKSFVPASGSGFGGGSAFTVGYTYDTQGKLTGITYPSGNALAVSYDSAARPSSLTFDGQTVLSGLSYRAVGEEVAGWTWGAPAAGTVSYAYDTDGRTASIVDTTATRTYGYDLAGRLTDINDPVNTADVQVYGYDALDRLTSANLGSYAAAISYTYDNTGNRLTNTDGVGTGTAHTTAWTMTSGSNKVASWKFGTGASIPWTTDGQGNLVNDGAGQTFAYDAKNQLVSSTTASGTTTYAYDATGQRTRKAGPLGTEQYVYDEERRLLGVYDGSGNLVEELVYLDGFRPVATVRPDGLGGTVVYPVLTDHRGTPRVVLDPSTGSAVWTWDATEPFGNQAPVAVGGFTFHGRFPGQRFDPESGLVNNGFRTYSAAAGRYVQSDPMGLAAGWNTYSYVYNTPLAGVDPYGLWWFGDPLPQGMVDFAAGTGDMASFGLTPYLRKRLEIDGQINGSSCAYGYGLKTGMALAIGTTFAGGYAVNIGVRAVGGASRLYHFTSAAAYSDIIASGSINASGGAFGEGVYAAVLNSSFYARIVGAGSTEAVIGFQTQGLRVAATAWPGSFRVIGGVVIP